MGIRKHAMEEEKLWLHSFLKIRKKGKKKGKKPKKKGGVTKG